MSHQSTPLHPINKPIFIIHQQHQLSQINRPPPLRNQLNSIQVPIMKNTPAAGDHQRAPCRRLLLLPGPSSSSSTQQHTISKPHPSKHLDLSEMLKRKLSLGAKIIQVGGIERLYRRIFKAVKEGERVVKASQCYLWTTCGPIAGMLFISTERVAFCSDRPIKFSSTGGELLGRSYYKVSIPVGKVNGARAAQIETSKRPKTEMYLKVVTRDEFEFWFMGIVGFNKTFKCLQQVVASQGRVVVARD